MNSHLSKERKQQQPSSFPSFRVNKQRATNWFSKLSFPRFKSKSGSFFSHSPLSSKSHSSLSSSDPSLSRAQSPSTITSKDSIYAPTIVSNQVGVASIKKSSKVRQTLDAAVPSTFEAPTSSTIARQSGTGRPIHSTAPQTTTMPDYRRPIPNYFASIPSMVPGSLFY